HGRQHRLGHARCRQHRLGHEHCLGNGGASVRAAAMTAMLNRTELRTAHTTRTGDWQVPGAVTSDWRAGQPVLSGTGVTLRELRQSDAAVLFALFSSEEVSRFITPAPKNVTGFERFIEWSARERAAGRSCSFAIVPKGQVAAIGFIQVRAREAGFGR